MRRFLIAAALIALAVPNIANDEAAAQEKSTTSYNGVIQPLEVIEVGTSSPGLLAEVLVERGETVKAGQVIARLQSDVEQQDSILARLSAESTAYTDIANLTLKSAIEKLESRESLASEGFLTEEELSAARADVALAHLELAAANEAAAIAQIQLKRADAVLARTNILAPQDAIVTQRHGSKGEIVTSAPEFPIYTLACLDPLRVETHVPVALLASLKIGDQATLVPSFDLSRRYSATLKFIDSVADAASETVRIEFELPNPDLSIPAGIRCTLTINE